MPDSLFVNRFVVVLDANVLYPNLVRDILLRLSQAGHFRAMWSETIMEEWQEAVIRNKPHLADNICRTAQLMKDAFPEAWVAGYEQLIPGVTDLPDEDDRHVIAAAIRSNANLIVTNNLKHFPEHALGPLDLEAVTPDTFLVNQLDLNTPDVLRVLRTMMAAYRDPPRNGSELISALTRHGLPKFAAALKPHIELLTATSSE